MKSKRLIAFVLSALLLCSIMVIAVEAKGVNTVKTGDPENYSVQFFNKQQWDKVYVYAWDGNGTEENAEWPGVLCALQEESATGSVYNAVIDSKYDTFVFSNGYKEMTVEIKRAADVTGYYPKEKDSRGKWEVGTYPEVIIDPTEPETTEAVTPDNTKIYFDASGWNNADNVLYCHIWERGSDSFFSWQSKKEKCAKEDDKYVYDTSVLKDSADFPNGLEAGKDYLIVCSNDKGKVTFDCTFGKACLGDTLKIITDNHIENPVDSSKTIDEAVWETNGETFGPHLTLTSVGNVIGKFLCPNEKGTEVIGDWLPVYYKNSKIKHIEVLANAFESFNIKTIDDVNEIYNYIVAKKTGEDEAKIKTILEAAFALMQSKTSATDPQQEETQPSTSVEKPPQEPTEPASTKATAPAKKPNPVKIKVKAKKIKVSKLKNGKVTIKPITISEKQGAVTITKVKKGTTGSIYKKITANKKTGAITFKKGKYAKKTYSIKLKIIIAGNSKYKAKNFTKIVKVKIK